MGGVACVDSEGSCARLDLDGHESIGYSVDINNVVSILLTDHNPDAIPSAVFAIVVQLVSFPDLPSLRSFPLRLLDARDVDAAGLQCLGQFSASSGHRSNIDGRNS